MVIRTATAKVQATVEFITGVKSGEFGEYRSVLFKRNDAEGEAAKIWRSFQPHEVDVFTKGQQVLLVPTERKGKATWDVELVDEAPTATAPATPQGTIPDEKKAAIAEYVATMAKLLSFCRQQAQQSMPDADPAAIQAATAALFIAAQRKFNL